MAVEKAAAEKKEKAEAEEGTINSDVKVKKAVVGKAIRALKQLVAKRSADSTHLFEEASEAMVIQFNLARIPERVGYPSNIPLPHPLYTEKSEVCFFSKSPQKRYKEMLMQKHPTPGLTKVIGVDKLKRRYVRSMERRQLADSYDLFLCDKRVIQGMHSYLGNAFFKQKTSKQPVPVSLKEATDDPAVFIRKAMAGTCLRLNRGNCVSVRFGFCQMQEEQLEANAKAVIAHGIKILGRHGLAVSGISMQATDSMVLLVWQRPAPPGEKVNLKQWREHAASSAASDTGASGVSDSEITGSEIISDAGETLSTRDSISEVDTSGETMSEMETADSEADDIAHEDLPLVQGLKKKKRRREGVPVQAEALEEKAKAPKKKAKGRKGA
ncbi:unnamed protein product [Effrenium voratum]|uniref:Ribosomal protein L1 n=1 Tax=Effrenium voratum TaxID=2562239 RepID=A0AA36IRT3_9DINO|nr:unnamed protein product [Effrenium voratum]CAJ1433960.1 unnamed protein product [Effrenium voratum]